MAQSDQYFASQPPAFKTAVSSVKSVPMLIKNRWFFIYLLVTLLVAFLVAFVMGTVRSQIIFVESAKEREFAHSQLDTFRSGLERELSEKRHLAHEFSAALMSAPEMSEKQLTLITTQLLKEHHGSAQIFIRPVSEVNNIVPNALRFPAHLEFSSSQEQINAIDRAVTLNETTAAGPISLSSGEDVFVWNSPVLLPSAAGVEPELWGVVTLAVGLSELTREHEPPEGAAAYDFVVIDHDDEPGITEVIFGDATVMEHYPVVTEISFHGDRWEIGAVPADGWLEEPEYMPIVERRFYAYGLAFFILAMLATRFVQQRLRAEKQLLGAINSLEGGFVYYDENDKLVKCNERYREMARLPKGFLQPGVSFESIIHEVAKSGLYSSQGGDKQKWITDRMAAHHSGHGEVLQHLDDGSWIKITDTQVQGGGRVSLLVDITDLVLAKDKAEAANRAKADFLSVISHELRTPLTSIIGFSSFLANPKPLPAIKKLYASISDSTAEPATLKMRADGAISELSGYIGRIERSGKHLLALVNDTLDFSKIDAGEMEVNAQEVAVDPVVHSVVVQLQGAAQSKGVEIVHSASGQTAIADELRFRQILTNLVGNAVKFTDSGTISITTVAKGPFIEVQVSDTGCGMPACDHEKVFEGFSQADTSSTRKAGGTGLGLTISKRLVELHGGQIGVHSAAGKGSTFWFTLPASQK